MSEVTVRLLLQATDTTGLYALTRLMVLSRVPAVGEHVAVRMRGSVSLSLPVTNVLHDERDFARVTLEPVRFDMTKFFYTDSKRPRGSYARFYWTGVRLRSLPELETT